MKVLPKTANPLVIRTDFQSQETWEKIRELIRPPVHDRSETFYAYLDFLDDVEFRNVTKEDLLASVPKEYDHSFLLVADAMAMESRDFPILVIDLHDEPGRTFRAIPSQTQSIENNLSIANMDFSDFADAVDTDGVFRGFPET
jgi:hypothetical protein